MSYESFFSSSDQMWEVAGREGQTEGCFEKVNITKLTVRGTIVWHSAPQAPELEAPLIKYTT